MTIRRAHGGAHRTAVIRPLAERLAARLTIRTAPPIVPARLGNRSAMLGAAVLARRLAGQ